MPIGGGAPTIVGILLGERQKGGAVGLPLRMVHLLSRQNYRAGLPAIRREKYDFLKFGAPLGAPPVAQLLRCCAQSERKYVNVRVVQRYNINLCLSMVLTEINIRRWRRLKG